MKKAVITGTERASIVVSTSRPSRGTGPKIEVHAAPMCTEYHDFEEGNERDALGHEAAGEVVESRSGKYDVGDRGVAMPLYACGSCEICQTGAFIHCENTLSTSEEGTATYAQHLLKPGWLLVSVPDGVSYDHAAMACCGLGPTYGANDRRDVSGVDTVLVSGAGPVGLGGVINTTHRGARVLVSEPSEFRAALARELGADAVVDPLEDGRAELDALTDGAGVDKAIECTGVPEAQRFAIDALGRRGELAFVGEGGGLEIDVSGDMIRNGLTLHGQWHYGRDLAPEVMSVVEANGEKLDAFITHEFPLEEVETAFELQSDRRTGKVVLHPWA